MALTRVQEYQVHTTEMGITDNITTLNQKIVGANTSDIGFVFDRGTLTNAAIVWNESNQTFRCLYTLQTGKEQVGTISTLNNAPLLTNNHYISGGNFVADGDAMSATYVMRNVTTNANATLLFLDGAVQTLVMQPRSVWTVSATIAALRTDAGGTDAASINICGAAMRTGLAANTTMIIGTTSTIIFGSTDPSLTASLQANVISGAVDVIVSGSANKTIRWVAKIDTVESTFS